MVGAVLAIVLIGLLASLSPTTIVGFILLLSTTRARVNAIAFLVGWGVSLAVVFGLSFALGGTRLVSHGSGKTAVAVVEVFLGVASIYLSARQWRRRHLPHKSSGVTTALTKRLKEIRPWQAAIVGMAEQPWTLTASAAIIAVRHHLSAGVALLAFLLFTIASTATVGLIYLYFEFRPGSAEAQLERLRLWVEQTGPVLFAVVLLLVGLFLIVDGAVGIA